MTQENNPSSTLTFEASQDIQNAMTTPHELHTDLYTSLDDVYEKVKLIWGTTINISETIETFKEILSLNYTEKIKKMIFTEQSVLAIDDLYELKEKFLSYPGEIIPILRRALIEYIVEINPQWTKEIDIVFNINQMNLRPVQFRNINTTFIDKIIMIQGIVLRVSNIIPEMVKACYVCQSCKNTIFIEKVKNLISEPTHCPCNVNFNFVLDYNKSQLIDKQIIKIQELNDDPVTVTVVLYKDHGISPGDKVNVLGILRASAILGFNQISNVFKGMVEGIGIEQVGFTNKIELKNKKSTKISENISNTKEPDNMSNLGDSNDQLTLNNQEVSVLKDASDFSPFPHAQRYESLTDLIAPSIYGHKDVKKALLLMLVGGITKNNLNTTLRGNINILLAGDPGVAKSQLLGFVNSVSKGIYTSGNGSTAAGLSASVTRDTETGTYVLESGALTLSDQGICIIDEFDKMNVHAQGVLHEAMEQQTISIAKAGIITSLNARCSVLASCNPRESVWNRNKSIRENISIVPTLLSRFDLIFILLDGNDPTVDKKMADFILGFYTPSNELINQNHSTEILENDDLNNSNQNKDSDLNKNSENNSNKDITFAGQKMNDLELLKTEILRSKSINCTISHEASIAISDSYIQLRSKSNKNIISATTRQLDAIIRLSEAHARVRLSQFVEVEDVHEAVRLIKESMLMYAIDPVTGKIDIDIVSGRSARERSELENTKKIILTELKKKKRVLKDEMIALFGDIGQTALNELIDEEVVAIEGDLVILNP